MKLKFILKPLDTIFFGEEKSPFKQEYFQQSRMLPQQTTVLGFLRYEALRRAGKLGKDPKLSNWDILIGRESFNGSNGQTFGIIKNISPVSIFHISEKYDLYPLRDPCGFKTTPIDVKVDFCDGTIWDQLFLFEKEKFNRFDPKKGEQSSIIFSDYKTQNFKAACSTEKDYKKAHGFDAPDNNGIFWPDIRPGITKNYKGIPNDEGYFRTKFWRMMSCFAYSFTTEIEENSELTEAMWKDKAIVRFGGDGSLYSMESVDLEYEKNDNTGNVFVLLSDALVNNDIYHFCSVAVTDTLHFRNIRTTTSDIRFTKRANEWSEWKKNPTITEAKIFMEHGSILIAREGEEENLANALSNETSFRNIGYNHYKRFDKLPKGIEHDNH